MKNLLQSILPLFFPEHCVGCKKRGEILCTLCVAQARHAERETTRHTIAGFDYREPVIKNALWELKYKKKKHIAKVLGEELYERTLEEISNIRIFGAGRPILIIPIPLSKARMRERGYNQAELLAKAFIKNAEENVFELRTDILTKGKDTPPQARIANRNKRLQNIKGAFSFHKNFNPNEIQGRTIIVVDDITTTGGTLTEAMQMFEKAGAKKVVGCAVAH